MKKLIIEINGVNHSVLSAIYLRASLIQQAKMLDKVLAVADNTDSQVALLETKLQVESQVDICNQSISLLLEMLKRKMSPLEYSKFASALLQTKLEAKLSIETAYFDALESLTTRVHSLDNMRVTEQD